MQRTVRKERGDPGAGRRAAGALPGRPSTPEQSREAGVGRKTLARPLHAACSAPPRGAARGPEENRGSRRRTPIGQSDAVRAPARTGRPVGAQKGGAGPPRMALSQKVTNKQSPTFWNARGGDCWRRRKTDQLQCDFDPKKGEPAPSRSDLSHKPCPFPSPPTRFPQPRPLPHLIDTPPAPPTPPVILPGSAPSPSPAHFPSHPLPGLAPSPCPAYRSVISLGSAHPSPFRAGPAHQVPPTTLSSP